MSQKEGVDQGVDKYQKKINELYRDRKKIVSQIKDLSKRQRLMSFALSKVSHDAKSQTKLIKQPSLQGQQINHEKSQKGIQSQQSISEQPQSERNLEDIKKVVQVQDGIKDRNRRLFMGLNIHLKKAEKKWSQDSSKVQSKINIEQKVSLKQKQQSQQFEEKKRKQIEVQFLQKLSRLTEEKDKNTKQLLVNQNAVLKNKFIAYVSDLQQHILTKSKPEIAWKPAKYNDNLLKLHEEKKEQFKKTSQQIISKIQSYNQKFDFSKYRIQNQKQFYSNYLDNYFRSKLNFIQTAAKPNVFWLPSLHNETTQQLIKNSNKMNIEERQEIGKNHEAFYKKFEKQPAIVEEASQDSFSDH